MPGTRYLLLCGLQEELKFAWTTAKLDSLFLPKPGCINHFDLTPNARTATFDTVAACLPAVRLAWAKVAQSIAIIPRVGWLRLCRTLLEILSSWIRLHFKTGK